MLPLDRSASSDGPYFCLLSWLPLSRLPLLLDLPPLLLDLPLFFVPFPTLSEPAARGDLEYGEEPFVWLLRMLFLFENGLCTGLVCEWEGDLGGRPAVDPLFLLSNEVVPPMLFLATGLILPCLLPPDLLLEAGFLMNSLEPNPMLTDGSSLVLLLLPSGPLTLPFLLPLNLLAREPFEE